jgi:hypothetical protein
LKDGFIYDTLATIENEDLIVNQAILVFSRNYDHGDFPPSAEVYISVLSKRTASIKMPRQWVFCHLTDDTDPKSVEDWGLPFYIEYKANSKFVRYKQRIEVKVIDGNPELLNCKERYVLNCKELDCNYFIKGVVIEYLIGDIKKYFVINKFKVIHYLYGLDNYFIERANLLKTVNRDN